MADGKSTKGAKRVRKDPGDGVIDHVTGEVASMGDAVAAAAAPADWPLADLPAAVAPLPAATWGVAAPAVAEDGASLEAEHVEVRLSAIGRVESTELSISQGAVGAARTQHLTVEQGAVGAVMADRVEVSRSYARSILARQVQLDRSAGRVVIAAEVNTQQSAVMFLIARRVSGDVRVLLDWRGALAFGAVAGLVMAILTRRGRRGR